MNKIKIILYKNISNLALFIAATSIVQCCSGKIYQPNMNKILKSKIKNLAQEKWHDRGHGSDKVL